MAKIIISRDGVVLQEVPLSRERMTIGRRSQNDIVIDHATISGQHAVIVTILDESFLEDLDSTNGTFVNGQRVSKHILQANDQITLAKFQLKFLADGVRPSAEVAPKLAAAMLPLPAPSVPTPPVLANIEVINGVNAGKQLALIKPLTTLGRPGVQVVVISRRHDGYSIAHIEGEQAPLLNDAPIGRAPHPLVDGDVINLAGTQMAFMQIQGATPR